jgi:hypothetical protein
MQHLPADQSMGEMRNMTSWETVKQFSSAVLPPTIHAHGLAAAGAMLTCIAVALNVGPFAKPAKINVTVENARSEAARLALEKDTTSSISAPEVESPFPGNDVQSAMEIGNTIEPIARSVEESSESFAPPVVELASSTSQPASPKDRSSDMDEKSPPDSSGSADFASLRHPDDSNSDLAKNTSIVGVWAPNPGTCSARDFREGALPAVISTDGAWAGETFCMFSNKKQTETGWNVTAKCSNPRERWTANVRLTVKDNRLTWTSRRGTQAYTRCAPDVLMAAAR